MSGESNRGALWEGKWNKREIGFHQEKFHPMLVKHFDKLKGDDGKVGKAFVPLSGKSHDLQWFSDHSTLTVGVDIVPIALKEFFTDNNIEYTQQPAPSMGPQCQLSQSNDGKIKLYCGDIFLYNESINGKFDVIWDRGSLVALDRPDVPSYVELVKKLLNPGGKILLEAMEYDKATKEEYAGRHPPPHAMFEDEIRGLYEPDCTVVPIDEAGRLLSDKPANTRIYLITKK